MTKIELKYFDIQGVGEKIRLAFVLNGVDFVDTRVKHDEWQKMKPESKFGQMPLMYIDDGPELAQSDALLRLAATMGKAKLMPKDPMDQFKVNEAINLVDDIQRSWQPAFYMGMRPQSFGYPEDFAKTEEGKAKVKEMREAWLKDDLPKYMGMVTKLLEANGEGKGFIASKDEPTIADCYLVPTLRNYQRGFIDHIPASSLDEYKPVTEYIERFLSIPEVAKWYSK